MFLICGILGLRDHALDIKVALLIITPNDILGGICTLCFCHSNRFHSRGSQRQDMFVKGVQQECFYILSYDCHLVILDSDCRVSSRQANVSSSQQE